MKLWNALRHWATKTPFKMAIPPLTYREFYNSILRACLRLPEAGGKRVGLMMGNSARWAVYDIAFTLKGACVVPLPGFFSEAQLRHIATDANLDFAVIDAKAEFVPDLGSCGIIEAEDFYIHTPPVISWPAEGRPVLSNPDRVVKIIYTSGTTGAPKGVMIRTGAIEAAMSSLAERCKPTAADRHLGLLPLSTLIEAIGGLYVPLYAGATVIYPAEMSLRATVADPKAMGQMVSKFKPTTLNLVPILLKALMLAVKEGQADLRSLRFAACGGAPVSKGVLREAWRMGIPVYQGYGLSECTSVVSLNGIDFHRLGSSGRALGHARIEITGDGEIVVAGEALMAGYAGGGAHSPQVWYTGDTGYMDEEGYLYVEGRKDNRFSTADGRNISPEWVENEILRSRAVKQVMVYGSGQAAPCAVIVPDPAWLSSVAGIGHSAVVAEMHKEVDAATAELPGYAAIGCIHLAGEAFTVENGLVTPNGRLRRREILKRYGGLMENYGG